MQHLVQHVARLLCSSWLPSTAALRMRLALVTALGAIALPAVASAQGMPPSAPERDWPQREQPRRAAPTAAPPGGACFAVSFGAWSPPLDPLAAGHALPRAPRDSTGAVRPTAPAGGGPGDAMTDPEGSEAALVLFPEWWPAGVGVRFSAGAGANDTTLSGIAQAFVANGRAPVPTASVTARRVPCGQSANTRPPAR